MPAIWGEPRIVDDPDTPDQDWDKVGDQISLTINTGISGWF